MSEVNHCSLPSAFSSLQNWSDWILEDELARRKKCEHSTMEEIQAFYDIMLASMEAMLEHLNQFPLDDMPLAEKNLLSLALCFVEASISVEMFEQPEVAFGFPIERFKPLHHLVP
jgi:hypothetical protein